MKMNNSSLIDLKAELLRKRQQFNKEKLSGTSGGKIKHDDGKPKKQDVWSRKNAGVLERSQRDIEAKQEEEDTLDKSRKILEAKAKIYEAMTASNTVPDEDGSKLFLVDFEQKAIDKIVEERDRARTEESSHTTSKAPAGIAAVEESKAFLNDPVPPTTNPEEEWVDFTDCLGRSRRCMKKDLPELMEMDRELSSVRSSKPSSTASPPTAESWTGPEPDLMSADMYRERLRQQWEREEQEAMEGPVGPLHYANVQHEEIRTHGVGFYQFNKKQEKRDEQMDELQKLREQTKEKRAAHQKVKDKRKAMLASRLNKVRQRKLIREGKDPLDVLNSESNDDSDEDTIGPRPPEKEPEPLTRDDSWRKEAPIRDWDKGKEGLDEFVRGRSVQSEDAWMEKLRSERLNEFAPPSLYDSTSSNIKSGQKQTAKSWQGKAAKMTQAMNDKSVDKQILNPQFSPPPSYPTSRPVDSQRNWSQQAAPIGQQVQQPDLEAAIGQKLSSIRAEVSGTAMGASNKLQSSSWEKHLPDSLVPDLANIPLPPSTSSNNPVPSNSGQLKTPQADVPVYQTVQQATYRAEMAAQAWNAPVAQVTPPTANNQQYSAPLLSQNSSLYPGYDSQTTIDSSATEYANILNTPTLDSKQTMSASSTDNEPRTPARSSASSSVESAPQPAHYSSAPMKPQPKKARYERVNLHELPLSLPVPPTAGNVPEYPSQEEVFGPQKPAAMSEEQSAKMWQRQFQYNKDSKKAPTSSGGLKPVDIPFASPYIQNKNSDQSGRSDPALKFDPCKPPPSKS